MYIVCMGGHRGVCTHHRHYTSTHITQWDNEELRARVSSCMKAKSSCF